LQQNITGGTGSGSTFTATVNPATNQLVGYSYDAAGNMTYDGLLHHYTYDAEGNITAVDNGQTAQYVYNAQNQRVSATVGGAITEWNGATRAQLKGKYNWGAKPVAYYAGGTAHFGIRIGWGRAKSEESGVPLRHGSRHASCWSRKVLKSSSRADQYYQ
jgi:YD repeat-containing protein